MSYATSARAKATAHTCGGPAFGKLTKGCPRCDELAAGAKPRQWHGTSRRQQDAQRSADIAAHFAGHKHRSGGCGPVCTFGEW